MSLPFSGLNPHERDAQFRAQMQGVGGGRPAAQMGMNGAPTPMGSPAVPPQVITGLLGNPNQGSDGGYDGGGWAAGMAPVGGGMTSGFMGLHPDSPLSQSAPVSGGFMGRHPDSPLAQQGSGLMRSAPPQSMGGLMDFNAQAQALAGPMPALPQFDFSPINISPSLGDNGGGNPPPGGNADGGYQVGQPTTGVNPDLAQPPAGQVGSGNPGSIGNVNDMIGQLNTMYGLGNPDAPNLMDVLGDVDWGNVGEGLLTGAAYLTGGPMAGMMVSQQNNEQQPAAPAQPTPSGTGGYMNVNLPGITLTQTGANDANGVNGLLGPTTSDSESITDEELAMIMADGASVTSGNSVDNAPTLLHQSGIEYSGLPGLNPAAVAVLNRRISNPSQRQR